MAESRTINLTNGYTIPDTFVAGSVATLVVEGQAGENGRSATTRQVPTTDPGRGGEGGEPGSTDNPGPDRGGPDGASGQGGASGQQGNSDGDRGDNGGSTPTRTVCTPGARGANGSSIVVTWIDASAGTTQRFIGEGGQGGAGGRCSGTTPLSGSSGSPGTRRTFTLDNLARGDRFLVTGRGTATLGFNQATVNMHLGNTQIVAAYLGDTQIISTNVG